MNFSTLEATSNDFCSELYTKSNKLDANDNLSQNESTITTLDSPLLVNNSTNDDNDPLDVTYTSNSVSKKVKLNQIDQIDSNSDTVTLLTANNSMQSDLDLNVDTTTISLSCDLMQKNVENAYFMKSLDDLQVQCEIEPLLLINNKNTNANLKVSFSSNSDGNEHTDETNSSISKITSMLSVQMQQKEPICLKRAQAISDLHSMNEYSDLIDIANDSKLDTPTIDSQSKSIDFIEENKVLLDGVNVRAADLPRLLQILIDSFDELGHVTNNSNYPRVFLLMHKWFMQSDELGKMLLDFYQKYEDDSKGLQLKTCHAFRFWIRNFPAHFGIDESLKAMISRFWALVRHKGHRDHIRFIDVSNIESYDWIRKQTKRNPIKSKSKTEKKSELAFDKLGSDVIAFQFTYLEWKTLRRITFNEYKSYAVKGSIQDNPPLERSIQLFNGMSQWIQTMVLKKTTPKQRAERIHKFIQVAQHLRQLQNFNSLMAVVGGICHSSIARLSKTNSHLSIEDQKALNDLMDLLSSNFNYAQYRKTISELKGFFIPIIGIHLKDMISLHTAHMDKLDNNLINFRKIVQLSVIFQSLNDLQNSESPVQANTSGYLEILQVALEMFYCEDEIYERSLNMEPRTSISSPSSPEKRQEFADWAKSISTPLDPRTIKKHVNDMVNTVFKNYDHDNDGFISNEEFNEIAQNFPFIDSFAVLDADKDGLISPEEMQTYFLKANHQALKNEFKHDFHEWTYYKPTYCILCDGLLWGLIKQGWKCVDCRINAHKHCKETLVMECRSKRNMIRHMSNSGTEQITRNRSTSNHSSARKNLYSTHKSNQTDAYDDIFMSGESTEEDNNDDISFIRSTTSNISSDQSATQTHLIHQSNRHKRYNKKSPKRRKSLPPQS